MNSRRIRTKLALGAVLGLTAAGTALAATGTGPSTTTDPYVLPVADGVDVASLLTVETATDAGAASNGYQMVGIPDGLGATFGPGRDDFRLFMNHELTASSGAVRDHGATGSFVSKWTINADTLEVEEGADLIQGVRYWKYATHEYSTDPAVAGQDPRFARFCSGFLSLPGQLYNGETDHGYDGQIYFANEENGDVGREFGVTTDGEAQQLPRLGLFSWENSLVGLNKGNVTYVQGQEDSAVGQLHVYVGHKQDHGNPFDRTGLTNGDQFVVDLHNEQVSTDAEFRAKFGKDHPAPFELGSDEQVDWDQTGAAQNADAASKGLSLNRIEDGAFDPSHPEDFYFVTTEGGKDATTGTSGRDGGGLWRLSYRNVERPWKGGTLTLLRDGSEAPLLNKPDNLGFDRQGHLMIQEDPGNNDHVARIVAYDVKSDEMAVVARFDPAQFAPAGASFITRDEESSGIIDASRFLGPRTFLFDAQVHVAHPDVDKVERGQLMTLHVSDWDEVFGG
jgi:Alkaline phosphatase PhoX